MLDARILASRYQAAHNAMRNTDGMQPQESLDELLKYVFFKERDELTPHPVSLIEGLNSQKALAAAAYEIRERFSGYVEKAITVPERWPADGMLLSDLALVKVHGILQGINLSKAKLDLRSSALREFLSGPIRKGLGIFLTPEDVAQEMVEALAPKNGDKILDPACGSGTFLMNAAQYVSSQNSEATLYVFGIDKNPRMVQLAEFNCGHVDHAQFKRVVADSLLPFSSDVYPGWFKRESFDLIITNPPFGVTVDERAYGFQEYSTCSDGRGGTVGKQGSEIVFVERALQLLKPGGHMAIVLPRSVVTNRRLAVARERLGRLGAVLAMITLPPETFAATGTQTTTVVLIVERYGPTFTDSSTVRPLLARIENVGFDLTGRHRQGSQLPGLGRAIAQALKGGPIEGLLGAQEPVEAGNTFAQLDRMLGEARLGAKGAARKLATLAQSVTTGATPPRAAYSDHGLFLVKVGNLTGAGVNWAARDRNYVSAESARRYERSNRLLVRGDILLTSSAHSSKYIGKKMDIITNIPEEVGARASFVGEVMLIRTISGEDPFLLLAYLRLGAVVQSLQDRVRGQTAHLHPDDVLELKIDEAIYSSSTLRSLALILREEAALNEQLNHLAFQQVRLRQALGEEPTLLEFAAE